jgi:hypothetical protein
MEGSKYEDEDDIKFSEALPIKVVLQTQALLKFYYEFSKKERNVEALDFYLSVLNYETLETQEERQELSKELYDTYINPTGTNSININSEKGSKVKENLETSPVDLFEHLKGEMEVLMMDPYRRFFRTPAYQEMLARYEIKNKVQKTQDKEEDEESILMSPGIGLKFFKIFLKFF